METKDTISQQIRETREARGLTSTQLADILEVPVDRLYKWEHGKAAPKFQDRQKIQKWLDEKTEKQPEKNSVDDFSTSRNSSDNSLEELIACNKYLSRAALIQAEADKIREEKELALVQNNTSLTEILKHRETTESAHGDNPLAHPVVQMKLLETLAELGVGTLWKTKDDGLIQLGNRLSVPVNEGETKGGTRVAGHKKSIA